jgi:hypothetical protein
VDSGPFQVRANAARFAARFSRREGRLEIAVQDGGLTVEGPGFAQRLVAGQRLVATAADGIVELAATAGSVGLGETLDAR